ncbi:MAG: hypothetical protein CENE_03305 [Candidatus Celerinatantimonas neptuna]|nr:MAG: hypothetical protein CENE_03305 [Candidatus Celerinatantimonas neptuna]
MSEQITIGEFITLGSLISQLSEIQTQLEVATEKTKARLNELGQKTQPNTSLQNVELSLLGLSAANMKLEKALDIFAANVLGGDENAR